MYQNNVSNNPMGLLLLIDDLCAFFDVIQSPHRSHVSVMEALCNILIGDTGRYWENVINMPSMKSVIVPAHSRQELILNVVFEILKTTPQNIKGVLFKPFLEWRESCPKL